ncbi:MAG: tetratricopeptide repeat protein [Peptococcaceae bacterium]|nr:tetratricopeptide repeat protein [Peptococcaceae bacterium]
MSKLLVLGLWTKGASPILTYRLAVLIGTVPFFLFLRWRSQWLGINKRQAFFLSVLVCCVGWMLPWTIRSGLVQIWLLGGIAVLIAVAVLMTRSSLRSVRGVRERTKYGEAVEVQEPVELLTDTLPFDSLLWLASRGDRDLADIGATAVTATTADLAETETTPDSLTKVPSPTQADSEVEGEADSGAESEADTEVESEADSGAESVAESVADAEVDSVAVTEVESEANTEIVYEVVSEVESEVEAKVDTRCENGEDTNEETELESIGGDNSEITLELCLDKGFAAKLAGDFKVAAEWFTQALNLNPDPDLAFYFISDAFWLWSSATNREGAIEKLQQHWVYYLDHASPSLRSKFVDWLQNENLDG